MRTRDSQLVNTIMLDIKVIKSEKGKFCGVVKKGTGI